MLRNKIYHFHNGKEGGVFSVIKNIIKFSQCDNHVIYTLKNEQSKDFVIPKIDNVKTQTVFEYSEHWNYYYTFSLLAKHLPDEKAIIIAHDWLELGMVSNLGLRNPVVYILHGDFDYYYNLANLHKRNIDYILGVSPVISRRLKQIISTKKIIDWRFPISPKEVTINKSDNPNMAFFVGDLTDVRKNYELLPKIELLLAERNIKINWIIAGGGLTDHQNSLLWDSKAQSRVFFKGFLNENQINEMLNECQAMILPSKQEGLPVSVVEAMKKGIVPFVSYWDGAVEDIVIEGVTGFYSNPENETEFADKIDYFFRNKELQKKMSNHAKLKADEVFDSVLSINEFDNLMADLKPRNGVRFKAYGSRLDHELIPNILVSFLRKKIKCKAH